MFKLFTSFFCLLVILVSTDTRAAEKLEFNKYLTSTKVPPSFLTLGGGALMVNKKYTDDDGKQRSDKVFYTVTHNYLSPYKTSDIAQLLDPSSGRLSSLFEDTNIQNSRDLDVYSVSMGISTPLKTFVCENTLNVKKSKSGNKDVYKFIFSNFNMVFTDMVIEVEVQSKGAETQIIVSQIAAVKASTYGKLQNFFAVGRFEKALKLNLAKFKNGLGGF